MNILPANEIKRHGVSVIEKKLKLGPVHVLKHNTPVFVVITEQEYTLLSKGHSHSGLFHLLDKKASGTRSRKDIDKQLSQERDACK